MNHQEWLFKLKAGDKVNFLRDGKEPREMLIRIADDERLFMVNASEPKSDLAKGEAVWREHGEGSFGERIEPIEDSCSIIEPTWENP
ncbi:MAG: hypothetical protein IPP10_15655 [Candidatus Competibacteraceae bacterium]|nr:hypothetical protein [Candidatus Competibacteraceae bacterium]